MVFQVQVGMPAHSQQLMYLVSSCFDVLFCLFMKSPLLQFLAHLLLAAMLLFVGLEVVLVKYHSFSFSVFSVGILVQVLPAGACALIGASLTVLTGTLKFHEAFKGFSECRSGSHLASNLPYVLLDESSACLCTCSGPVFYLSRCIDHSHSVFWEVPSWKSEFWVHAIIFGLLLFAVSLWFLL